MKNTIFKYTAVLGLSMASFSCSKDYLDKTPQSQITIDNFYQTTEQVNASTAGLYSKPWFNYHYNAAHLIEGLAGNTTHWNSLVKTYAKFGYADNDAENNLMWGAFYRVIAFSNVIIVNMPKQVAKSVPQTVVNQAMAEARFMRAAAYFYLVRLYGAVPIIENSEDLVTTDMNLPRNTVESVYEFILRDLKFAEENGRPKRDLEGRVTKWAAKGLMAKVYLQTKDYANAKIKTEEIINSGEYALNANYGDNFRQLKDNNQESIFALQWNGTDHWTAQNTSQAWCAPGGITDVGDGWTAYVPTLDILSRYESGDKRRKESVMLNGDVYPELISLNNKSGFTYNAASSGGSATNSHWRKLIVGAPPKNGGTDGFVDFMRTGQNTNVIRYADVLLMNAEATIGASGSTSDAKALASYNAVRKRAGLVEKTVITIDNVFDERRVELAGEFDFWYDLQRMDRTKALAYIESQNRGDKNTPLKIAGSTVKWNLPIPVGEIDRSPKLKDAPVAYVFKN